MSSDNERTSERSGHRLSRRQYVQAASSAGLLVGAAGCTGGTNGQDGSGTTTTTTKSSSGGQKYSDVTFTWWDIWNAQSDAMRQFLEKEKAAFEKETGATINVNWSGYGSIADGTWLTNFNQGNYPTIASYGSELGGAFHKGGWTVDASRIQELLDEQTMSYLDWQMSGIKSSFRGYGGELLEFPVAMQMLSPLVVRTDHMKQAGLDPNKDFPPESYEELVELAKTLEKDGPGNVGFQPLGGQYDAVNTYNVHWSVALTGAKGLILNDDYSDTLLDTDGWKKELARYVGTYTEENLGLPSTPSATDEDQVANLASGNVSMAYYESPNHPTMLSRAPKRLENGTIKYGPSFGGKSGQRTMVAYKTFALMNAPEGEDTSGWKRKQEAALDFASRFMKTEKQKVWPTNGMLPIRKDVYSELDEASGAHNFVSASKEAAETVENAFGNHPQLAHLMFNVIQPYIQQAFQKQITPEKAAEKAARDVRENL